MASAAGCKGQRDGEAELCKLFKDINFLTTQQKNPWGLEKLTQVFDVCSVSGDGNCFYASVLRSLGLQQEPADLRRAVAELVCSEPQRSTLLGALKTLWSARSAGGDYQRTYAAIIGPWRGKDSPEAELAAYCDEMRSSSGPTSCFATESVMKPTANHVHANIVVAIERAPRTYTFSVYAEPTSDRCAFVLFQPSRVHYSALKVKPGAAELLQPPPP